MSSIPELLPPRVVWCDSLVSVSDRAELLNQRPITVWLTGLSGAGKSTLAASLEASWIQAGRPCYMLDGDNLRHGLNRDLGFSPKDRSENIRRIAEVARLLNEAGTIAIVSAISPHREDREMARRLIGPERFAEIHVSTPLAVCELRDPKKLYVKARRGEIAEFTGISAPYDAPESPLLSIDTSCQALPESVELLSRVLDPLVCLGERKARPRLRSVSNK